MFRVNNGSGSVVESGFDKSVDRVGGKTYLKGGNCFNGGSKILPFLFFIKI